VAVTLEKASPTKNRAYLWERMLAGGLAFLIFALFMPRMLDYLRPPTGDEIFYLITAKSLYYDHDLDETNQFQDKAWLEFYPTCAEYQAGWQGFTPPGIPCTSNPILKPEPTKTSRAGIYSKHGLGLSVIIFPAYVLGGRLGVVLLLNGIAALLTLNIWLLAWEVTGQKRLAWICWAVMGFCAPVFSYAYLIFPQLTAGLCVIYVYRRARLSSIARQQGERANNSWQMLGVGLCLGVLPWLHNLYLVLAAVLAAYFITNLIHRHPDTMQRVPTKIPPSLLARGLGLFIFFLPVIILGTLYLAYLIYFYGLPLPNAGDHDGFSNPLYFPLGFFGLLFDQKYGLLMYNPVYLIPIAWMFRQWFGRKGMGQPQRQEFFWLLVIIVPYYLVVADYAKWWGQWCPPARYLLPIVPLLVGPLAQAMAELKNRFAKWYLGIAVGWAGVITLAFGLDPRLSYHWEDTNPAKISLWLENNLPFLKDSKLGNFFPGYTNLIEPLTPVFWFAHAAWLGLAVWLGYRLIRQKTLETGKIN